MRATEQSYKMRCCANDCSTSFIGSTKTPMTYEWRGAISKTEPSSSHDSRLGLLILDAADDYEIVEFPARRFNQPPTPLAYADKIR